ncbi:hypothetical protein BN59_02881 [Legionella massiliensis]|uniref:Substrate of the Dot/Icm secretion system n=1 Tax=Legionella massiliensis TaxID=1034943 RepID=A0A078L093_9GAMM|nr:hypothetical protein [Legionella massiliensis]CDZ78571.1 hypothetical protein BN59_02881 [Legionella massiliensis]CEE14309.1 hypothetical protein BN1094_02881 [Legionella massiliensis]
MTRKSDKELEQERTLQRLAEEQAEREKAALLQQAQEEEEAKRLRALGTQDEENPIPVEVSAKPLGYSEDWIKIVDAYKKEFDKDPGQDGILVFPDKDSMDNFFNKQAAAGHKFFSALVEADGKLTGHFEFSCGDGKRHSGSLEQIKDELTRDLATAGPNKDKVQEGLAKINKYIQETKPNPSQSAKKALRDLTQPSEEQPGYKSPSPLSTDNKPK